MCSHEKKIKGMNISCHQIANGCLNPVFITHKKENMTKLLELKPWNNNNINKSVHLQIFRRFGTFRINYLCHLCMDLVSLLSPARFAQSIWSKYFSALESTWSGSISSRSLSDIKNMIQLNRKEDHFVLDAWYSKE